MKKILLNLLISCLALMAWTQNTDEARITEGKKAYEAGKYDAALAAYTQLTQKGYQSFELYYNLGNTYFKLNDIANAILNYERAKKLNQTDEDLLFNLQLANTKITDKVSVLPTGNGFKKLTQSLNTDTWGLLSLAAFILATGTLFLFLYIQSLSLKRFVLGTFFVLIFFSIFAYVLAHQSEKWRKNATEGIIFNPSVTVMSSPNASGTQLFVIHEGLKVEILESNNKHLKIKLADGNVGWINETDLEKI